jgi:O-antigen/teichoic acid export membrane protein
LRKNVLLTIGGNIVYAASQWLLLVVLAKLGDTSSVGLFSLSLAINTPVLVLTKLQLRAIQVTDAKEEYSFEQYLSLRMYCSILTFAIVVPIAFLVSDHVHATLIILVLTLAKAIEMIGDMFNGLLQKYERMDLISLSLVIKGASSVAVFGLMLWATDDLLWGSVGLAIIWGVLLVLMDARMAVGVMKEKAEGKKMSAIFAEGSVLLFKDRRIRSLLMLALPMGIAGVLNALASNIPRYVVQHDLNTFALGIFSGIAYLVVAGDTIVGAFGQTVSPRLAKYYASCSVRPFVKLLSKSIVLAIGIGAMGVLVAVAGGKTILPILYNSDFTRYSNLFIWIMVAGGATYVVNVLGVGVTAMRRFKIQIPVHVMTNAAMLVLCPMLLGKFDLTGVAYAMTISSVLSALAYGAIILYSIAGMRKREEAGLQKPIREVHTG